MTREQKEKELFSCEKFVEDYGTTGEHFYKCHTIDDLLDKIFDDHEAQLKAKDEKLQQINGAYAEVVLDFESAVMEIERLKAQLSSVHNLMYRNGYSDAIDCYDTFGKFNTKHKPNAKSRSIVAMLFWEWRKYNSNFKNEENSFIQGRASKTKELFYKAHKMLKEKQ